MAQGQGWGTVKPGIVFFNRKGRFQQSIIQWKKAAPDPGHSKEREGFIRCWACLCKAWLQWRRPFCRRDFYSVCRGALGREGPIIFCDRTCKSIQFSILTTHMETVTWYIFPVFLYIHTHILKMTFWRKKWLRPRVTKIRIKKNFSLR